MAKACGLRIGPRRFELVVLDGSSKKPKIVQSLVGQIPPDEEDPVGAAAHALKAAIKSNGISTDNLGLVIDSRIAAFRELSLPVEEVSKIESVLKFEVESQLPQFNIEDVVVDFYIKDVASASSSLLVTAVPKEDLRAALEVCSGAGFDPLEIEVETTALVNAAASTGVCAVDEAQILVHVGEESTAVALVDGGKVREMRVIQVGALSYSPHGHEGTADASAEGEDDEEDLVEHQEGGAQANPERVDELVQRIRRELSRTVSAARTSNELTGVYFSGFSLPGLVEGDILGIPINALEGFELEGFERAESGGYGDCAVAYGAALNRMGGGIIRPSLRREELKFSGAMERLELPVAVMCLLITTFLGVWYMYLGEERRSIDSDLQFMLDSSVNYMIGDPKNGKPGNLRYPPEALANYVEKNTGRVPGSDPPAYRADPIRNRYEQLVYVRSSLQDHQRELQKQLGHDTEQQQPQSALKALTLVLDQIATDDDRYGRMAFHKLDADYNAATTRNGDSVTVVMDVAFFDESSAAASSNYEALINDLRDQPWCLEVDYSSSDPIDGLERGVFLPSLRVNVDVSKSGEVEL